MNLMIQSWNAVSAFIRVLYFLPNVEKIEKGNLKQFLQMSPPLPKRQERLRVSLWKVS